jgi:di/tripeptidase
MIDKRRLSEEFLELASIPSLSRREESLARRLESILRSIGASTPCQPDRAPRRAVRRRGARWSKTR